VAVEEVIEALMEDPELTVSDPDVSVGVAGAAPVKTTVAFPGQPASPLPAPALLPPPSANPG
jgi:hypothetical protein